jgi:hypothetical protein
LTTLRIIPRFKPDEKVGPAENPEEKMFSEAKKPTSA